MKSVKVIYWPKILSFSHPQPSTTQIGTDIAQKKTRLNYGKVVQLQKIVQN